MMYTYVQLMPRVIVVGHYKVIGDDFLVIEGGFFLAIRELSEGEMSHWSIFSFGVIFFFGCNNTLVWVPFG